MTFRSFHGFGWRRGRVGVAPGGCHAARLKVAILAGRLEGGPAKLCGDIIGGDVEASRRRAAPFQEVGGEERDVPAQRVRGKEVQRGAQIGRDDKLRGTEPQRSRQQKGRRPGKQFSIHPLILWIQPVAL